MYRVIDIIEPDFGCEGLPDGEEICCEVWLEKVGCESSLILKVPDAELYRKNINIGCMVTYENGQLEKTM